MKAQSRRDTKPERAIRSLLFREGFRYRVDVAVIPGTRRRADIVFRRAKVVVFIDGCFWHNCPEHGTWPKSSAAWWRAKINSNIERDRDTDRRLAQAGWRVVRVWEHEDPAIAATSIAMLVRDRGS